MADAIRTELNTRTRSWSAPYDGAVGVLLRFWFDRPAKSKYPDDPTPIRVQYGDVDKLARNVLDALVDASLIADDAQVSYLVVDKCWAKTQQGVMIEVDTWTAIP